MNWAQVAHQAAVNAGHPDPDMFVRQMMAESNLDPNARSQYAIGIAQITPDTAKGWGVNPNDPVASLNAAAKAMTKYLHSYHGNAAMALAAYNAGVGAVQQYRGVPPYAETRNYIAKIMNGHGAPSGGPAAPQNGSYAPQSAPVDSVALSNQANKIAIAYAQTPEVGQAYINNLYDKLKGGGLASGPQVPGHNQQPGPNVKTGPGVPARMPGETGQHYLDRIATSMFGLRHDPGNGQTTGGNHKGHGHYDGRATDFGDALNTPQQLNAWDDYADSHAQELGLKFSWYGSGDDPSGVHNNHSHTETIRSLHHIDKGAPVDASMTKSRSKRTRPARKKRVGNVVGNPYQQ